MYRFTCVSSMGRDTLPLVLLWWELRSWRCRRVTWVVTRTLMTTNDMFIFQQFQSLFSWMPYLTGHSSDLLWRYGTANQRVNNIFIWKCKQYFDNELYVNVLGFKVIQHLALCGTNLIIVALKCFWSIHLFRYRYLYIKSDEYTYVCVGRRYVYIDIYWKIILQL